MKFVEFRSLIEERKELAKGLIGDITFLRIKEIDKKLCYEEYIKIKDITNKPLYLDLMKSKINLLFEVGYEKVAEMLKKYFTDEGGDIAYTSYPYRENIPTFMELRTTKGTYDLGCYNDILYCLCTKGIESWERLLKDYPNLKDYLWNEFKELKNAEKIKEMTLIQKMLAKNNEEIDLLISPSKRETRISELLDESTKMQKQIEEISESLEEIDIVKVD